MANQKARNSSSLMLACLLLVCSLSGCAKFEPDKTVQIEVAGLREDADRKEVLEILKTMYDEDVGAKLTRSRYSDGLLSVKMYPVSDVEAFSRRINFGTVTNVSDRTIKIRYVRRQSSPTSTI